MKKSFTLFLVLLTTATLMAQDLSTIIFVDQKGQEMQDGATITVSTPVTDDFGETLFPSGLFAKNISAENAGIRIHYTIESLENGIFQICFPTNCVTKTTTGSFVTESDLMSAGQTRDLQTEWIPEVYGQCKVVYQIELMNQTQAFPPKFDSKGMGPTVTVIYSYDDSSAITAIGAEASKSVVARYSLDGRSLTAPHHGIVIERLVNGQLRKTINR